MKVVDKSLLESGTAWLMKDGLGHEELAKRILQVVFQLPLGSVIAIEGSWGRGKTDVLSRIASLTYEEEKLSRIQTAKRKIRPNAIWLNPWKYSNPDLLTPLMYELYGRLPKETVLARGWS